jgi:hypothetical protein
MAIVHEINGPIAFEEGPPWTGSAELAPPVIVRHRIGDAGVAGMQPLFDASTACTYYTTSTGETAVMFRGAVKGIPDQLLLATRPGFEYALVYAHAPAAPMFQRAKDRTILSMALAHRGRGHIAHANGFLLDGAGVLCPGLPSAGKSTLARLLQRAGAPVTLLSDDRIAVTLERDGTDARVWGTPWPGDANVIGASDGPLRAMVLLRHAEQTSLTPLAPRDAARRLMETLVLPLWSPRHMPDALEFVHHLLGAAPMFQFEYPPTPEAVEWLIAELRRRIRV